MMPDTLPRIMVLGASGLIGEALSRDLLAAGFPLVAVARRFTCAQLAAFGLAARKVPVLELSPPEMAGLLDDADVIVNCIGVLQDGPRGSTAEVHHKFVTRLLDALSPHQLLIQTSIPQSATPDRTPFSVTKRQAEDAIRHRAVPHVILRPGFVIGAAAYGGSALIRALAAWPLKLPARYAAAPFATTDIHDIGRAVMAAATAWRAGPAEWTETWDVMEVEPPPVGAVIAAFRHRLGLSGRVLPVPLWMLNLGARLGDLVSYLGWSPPVRSTALREMRRGVAGDTRRFTAITGITPSSLAQTLARQPVTVQEKWFSRLYLLKPLAFAVLTLFWCVSGCVALFVSFDSAVRILTAHGVPEAVSRLVTIASSCLDIAIGLLIAFRRSSSIGLWAGIAVSLGYMLGTAILTPDMWVEPLGPLVKTGPAIVLMGIVLAMLEER